MPLSKEEIGVGCVAYFDVEVLNSDERVSRPEYPTTRPSPFVCFQIEGEQSAWAPITTQWRKERLVVSKSWREDGSVQWRTDDLYLNDGACTYVGPNDAFMDAAANETPFTVINRPRVTSQGVEEINAAVAKRRGRTL